MINNNKQLVSEDVLTLVNLGNRIAKVLYYI